MRLVWLLLGVFMITLGMTGYELTEHFVLLKDYIAASLSELCGIVVIVVGCSLIGWIVTLLIKNRHHFTLKKKK